MFTKAIVRPPVENFAAGLTSVDLGKPDHQRALQQHAAYCNALALCGLKLITLQPDQRHPDSAFVEDTAIVTGRGAVITRPGAESRLGETEEIERALRSEDTELHHIVAPGTVDGGDICEAGNHFFIGLSHRTNEAGATQLASIFASLDYSSSLIDIRGLSNILHLKRHGLPWRESPGGDRGPERAQRVFRLRACSRKLWRGICGKLFVYKRPSAGCGRIPQLEATIGRPELPNHRPRNVGISEDGWRAKLFVIEVLSGRPIDGGDNA